MLLSLFVYKDDIEWTQPHGGISRQHRLQRQTQPFISLPTGARGKCEEKLAAFFCCDPVTH